jgi:formate--tetrahydrofolate ligase
VIVATVRALKMHGGVGKIVAGKPLDPALNQENVAAVEAGAQNLAKQIENVLAFGIPAVVAINKFPTDTPAEHEAIKRVALAAGARAAVISSHFTDGGKGAAELAEAVWAAVTSGEAKYAPIYADDAPLAKKIETIAMRIYGADGVDIAPAAAKRLARLEELGYGKLPICMAKTQYSLSHDASKLGRPTGFRVPVRGVTLAAGAGFITAICGDMRLMPGLNKAPGGERIDLDLTRGGEIVGLF